MRESDIVIWARRIPASTITVDEDDKKTVDSAFHGRGFARDSPRSRDRRLANRSREIGRWKEGEKGRKNESAALIGAKYGACNVSRDGRTS